MKREKAEKLFDLLGGIDDEIIAEADVAVENKPSQIVPFKQKRNLMHLTTIAASIMFLAVSIWGFNQLGPQNDGDSSNMVMEVTPELDLDDGDFGVAGDVGEDEGLDGSSSFDRWIGDFSHQLTDEQIAAVFPGFDFPVMGVAHYWRDGTLSEVFAHIYTGGADGTSKRISIARGALHPCCSFYSEDPVYLEIYGVEVIIEHRAARFMLDDVGYIMYLHYFSGTLSQIDEEIISQLILGGPADLSVLENPEIPEM